jgi:signal-transduction protein with cAMP-binding, CBS, and nucleotidyltransferase domain
MSAVAGDPLLAEDLRRDAIAAASKAPAFLQQLATELDAAQGVIGLFGGFRLQSGRVDLKRAGLLPITSGARVLALRHGIAETATDDRLRVLTARRVIRESDAEDIVSARALIVDAILRQQLADVAAGSAPGSRVDPSRLARSSRRRLRDAVKRTTLMAPIVESALSG